MQSKAARSCAITKLAPDIFQVSAERIRDELTKILTEGAARRGFELLDETKLLPEILPEIARMKGVEQPPQFHPEGDVWIHTLMMLEQLQPAARPRSPGASCCTTSASRPPSRRRQAQTAASDSIDHVEVGAQMAEEICRRLRFSNDDTAQIVALVANHLRFKDVAQMKPSTLKRFVRLQSFRGASRTAPARLPLEPPKPRAPTISSSASWPRPLPSRSARPASSPAMTLKPLATHRDHASKKF